MKDGAAILKILSAQNFYFQNMIKMAFYRDKICEYELKNNFILELLTFSNTACWAYWRTFPFRPYHRSTGFEKHLPSQVLPKNPH